MSALVGVDEDVVRVEFIAHGPHDFDVTKAFWLFELDGALFEEFEQCEEPDDHIDPVRELRREPAERDLAGAGEFVEELRDGISHGDLDRVDVEQVDDRLRPRRERLDRRVLKALHARAFEHVRQHIVESFVGADDTGKGLVRLVSEPGEHASHVFEGFGFEQSGEQHVALFPQCQLIIQVDVAGVREQPPGLQVDQGGSDQQEARCNIEVQFGQALQFDEVGIDDRREVDLVDIDLFLEDQLQQQIEWPLIDRCCDVDHSHKRYRSLRASSGIVSIVNSEQQPRVLSCIQPTGDLHLGNYLGALRHWVSGQHSSDAFHGIVDLHALTVTEAPDVVGAATLRTAAMLFAIGLDPDVATVFAQSHVPEHNQLGWVMECTVSFGELSRMTQFKDKSAKREQDFVSGGLFTYPALQAADILLYDTNHVPVGEDQRQHIEITRDAAVRFNHRFGDTFVIPEAVTPKAGARVMSLQDPTSKMSKSDDSDAGCVYLIDDPKALMKKFKRAVTDSDTGPDAVRFDRENKPGVSSLLEINAAVTDRTPQAVADDYEQYGALKIDTGEAVLAVLDPIRQRYDELMEDRGELARLLRIGAGRAREVAAKTVDRAYSNIGMLPA
jgi:tryptophanyl-tRNA synthetase